MKGRSLPPQVIVFLLIAALGLIGKWLSIPFAANLVVMCIGLACLVVGLRMLITRQASFSRPGRGYYEEYSGLAAQLWGVLFLFFAVLFGIPVLVTLFLPGGIESFLAILERVRRLGRAGGRPRHVRGDLWHHSAAGWQRHVQNRLDCHAGGNW